MKTNDLIYSVVSISNEDNEQRLYEISAEVHVCPDNSVKAIHNGVVKTIAVIEETENADSSKEEKLAGFCDVNGVSLDRVNVTDDEYMQVMMAVYQFCQDVRQMVSEGYVVIVVSNPYSL